MSATRRSRIHGPLEIVVDHPDDGSDGVVITLHGELALGAGDALADELAANSAASVLVDLSELRFIDSTGLRLLLKAQRRASAGGHAFALRRGPEAVQRIFALAELDEVLPFEHGDTRVGNENGNGNGANAALAHDEGSRLPRSAGSTRSP